MGDYGAHIKTENDSLQAELARVTAERDAALARANVAEQSVCQLKDHLIEGRKQVSQISRDSGDDAAEYAIELFDYALSHAEPTPGRWIERKRYNALFSVAQVEAAERDAAFVMAEDLKQKLLAETDRADTAEEVIGYEKWEIAARQRDELSMQLQKLAEECISVTEECIKLFESYGADPCDSSLPVKNAVALVDKLKKLSVKDT